MVSAPPRGRRPHVHPTGPRDPAAPATPVTTRTARIAQLAVVLGLAATVSLAYVLHDGFRAEMMRGSVVLASGNGEAIGVYLRSYGVWAPIASLGLMLAQAVAAPVPIILVAFANALTFGVFWGALLTLAGQVLAAVACFGIARALGRAPVEALTSRFGLDAVDRWFTSWGAPGIFLMRLVPGVSFDVVSYAAGLTGIGFRPFLVATAAGVAPQTFFYAWLIHEAPRLAWTLYGASWLLIGVVLSGALLRLWRRESASRRGEHLNPPASRSLAGCE